MIAVESIKKQCKRLRSACVLMLALCLPAYHAPAQNGQSSEKLLTDAELLTDADPDATTVDEKVADWVRRNAHPIRSLTAERFDDLQFLKPLLKDKRIVQLGESGHGVAEFNLIKVRLVKFLHQQMGFEVLAFESPLYECYRADQRIKDEPPAGELRNCLFAIWHTREIKPLFDYISNSKKGETPLILAGLDVQPRGWGEHARPEFLRDVVAGFDPEYAGEVYLLDSEVMKKTSEGSDSFNAFIKNEGQRIVSAYDRLAGFLKQQEVKLKREDVEQKEKLLLARQTAFSISQLFKHRSAADRARSEVRDRGMADNLDFLLSELYPGKKIIVWAHNAHIRHNNEANAALPVARMGSLVAKRHRREVYTIGLYMYRGRTANNGRRVYEVAKALPGSLEAILYQARKKYLFVDLSRQKEEPGNSWLFKPVPTYDWGKNEERLVLRDQYDGILFIDTVNPPAYGVR